MNKTILASAGGTVLAAVGALTVVMLHDPTDTPAVDPGAAVLPLAPAQAPDPARDSPAESLQTLMVQMREQGSRLRTVSEQAEMLAEDNRALTQELETLKRAPRRTVVQAPAQDTAALVRAEVDDRLQHIEARLLDLLDREEAPPLQVAAYQPSDGLPLGGGGMVWSRSLDAPQPARVESGDGIPGLASITDRLPSVPRPATVVGAEPKADPVLTVPVGATLTASVGMTGLIGRVPRDGTVEDPYRFKALISRENLISNGFTLPGLTGAVVVGNAVGDWALGCVRGQIDTVLFTFADGSFSSVLQENVEGSRDIAWISDPTGVPCIQGRKISDAGSILAGRVALATAQGAANAYAITGTDSTTGAAVGTTTTTIEDPGRVVAGAAVADGLDEAGGLLEERLATIWDAVYVRPGGLLAVHIEVELHVDRPHGGRRLSYENTTRHIRPLP